jgi:hypothetical protein
LKLKIWIKNFRHWCLLTPNIFETVITTTNLLPHYRKEFWRGNQWKKTAYNSDLKLTKKRIRLQKLYFVFMNCLIHMKLQGINWSWLPTCCSVFYSFGQLKLYVCTVWFCTWVMFRLWYFAIVSHQLLLSGVYLNIMSWIHETYM